MTNKKEVFKGIVVFLFYIVSLFAETLPFDIFNVDLATVPKLIKIIYVSAYELIVLGVIVLVYKDELKKFISDLKSNYEDYYRQTFKYWLIALGISYVCNMILIKITGDVSNNEAALRQIFDVNPLYLFFSSLIYAPIVEELVFRFSIRKIFKNDILYVIISGVSFGLLHVITSATTFAEFLYFIPYSLPGIAFAYMLVKTKNALVPMSYHLLHNGLALSLYIFTLIFS